MRIAAVVVTYNRLALLRECVSHLQKQTVSCDILVVNNHSTDGTAAWLEEMAAQGQLRFVDTGENLGGAGGFHVGMRRAVEEGYEAVWIMDDDTLPSPDALAALVEGHEALEGQYGFLSSVALWKDGRECRMNRQKLHRAYYEKMEMLPRGLILCDQATFVSCFFPAASIVKAGLPIREFFIWGDDIEYTRRMTKRLKMPGYLACRSVVTHAMQDNTGSNIATDACARIGRYNYAYRNENYLYRKEGLPGFLFYTAKCGRSVLRILFQAKDHRIRRLAIVIKQYFAGLFFNPPVEYVMPDKNNE